MRSLEGNKMMDACTNLAISNSGIIQYRPTSNIVCHKQNLNGPNVCVFIVTSEATLCHTLPFLTSFGIHGNCISPKKVLVVSKIY